MNMHKRCTLINKKHPFLHVFLLDMHRGQVPAPLAFQLTSEANEYSSGFCLNHGADPEISALASSFATGTKFGQIGHLNA
jgi:hypothetical protein